MEATGWRLNIPLDEMKSSFLGISFLLHRGGYSGAYSGTRYCIAAMQTGNQDRVLTDCEWSTSLRKEDYVSVPRVMQMNTARYLLPSWRQHCLAGW